MRIVSGKLKRSKLATPAGKATRPPLARMRKSIFDMLGARLPGARILDLYAGTGSLSVEALSRGAESAVLVERSPDALAALRANLERLGLGARTRVLADEVAGSVSRLAEGGQRFEIVFSDPPFADPSEKATASAVALLAENGVLVWRTRRAFSPPPAMGGAAIMHMREYGASRVSFYRKGGTE